MRQMRTLSVAMLLIPCLLVDPCRALAVGWSPRVLPVTPSKTSYQTQALTLMLLAAAWTGASPRDPMVLRRAAHLSRTLGSKKKRQEDVLRQLKEWLGNGSGILTETPLVFHYSHETKGRRVLHRIEVSVENVYAGHIDFVFDGSTRLAWMDMAFQPTRFVREAIAVASEFRQQGIGHRLIELAALLVQLEGATRFTAKQVHIENSLFYVRSGFRVARRPEWFLQLSLASKAKGHQWPYWVFPIMNFRMNFKAPFLTAPIHPIAAAA